MLVSAWYFDFNPHEREARDADKLSVGINTCILIHTSVKLVTKYFEIGGVKFDYFNPHEREARDPTY